MPLSQLSGLHWGALCLCLPPKRRKCAERPLMEGVNLALIESLILIHNSRKVDPRNWIRIQYNQNAGVYKMQVYHSSPWKANSFPTMIYPYFPLFSSNSYSFPTKFSFLINSHRPLKELNHIKIMYSINIPMHKSFTYMDKLYKGNQDVKRAKISFIRS